MAAGLVILSRDRRVAASWRRRQTRLSLGLRGERLSIKEPHGGWTKQSVQRTVRNLCAVVPGNYNGEKMKPVRWTPHALQNLADRENDRSVAEATLDEPEFAVPDPLARQILMRRYFDGLVQQEMLLRMIVEEAADETVVVTVYKTSQIDRYVKGLTP